MSETTRYLGSLGQSMAPCMAVGILGYAVDSASLVGQLGAPSESLEKYNYYVIKAAPSFKTELLSHEHKIFFGVKRVDLSFSLRADAIAIDRFPIKEEETLKKDVEYEYGVTVSAKGEVEFKPFKASLGPEAKWNKVTKFTVSTINTYCYATGRLTASPGWVFEPRAGETHLKAEREVLLTVQVPKRNKLAGRVSMLCQNLVLLDENNRQLSPYKKFVVAIKKLIRKDQYSKPIEFDFPLPERKKIRLPGRFIKCPSCKTTVVAHGAVTFCTSCGSSLSEAAPHEIAEYPIGRVDMPNMARRLMPEFRLSNRTVQLIDKELARAGAKGLLKVSSAPNRRPAAR